MVGVGFAWASIVSLPYALLAGSVPSRKMGVYMGIFNFFIVIPQLVAASVLSDILLKPSARRAADLSCSWSAARASQSRVCSRCACGEMGTLRIC